MYIQQGSYRFSIFVQSLEQLKFNSLRAISFLLFFIDRRRRTEGHRRERQRLENSLEWGRNKSRKSLLVGSQSFVFWPLFGRRKTLGKKVDWSHRKQSSRGSCFKSYDDHPTAFPTKHAEHIGRPASQLRSGQFQPQPGAAIVQPLPIGPDAIPDTAR